MIASSVKETTLAKHQQQVRLRLIPALGKLQLTALTPQHVQRLYSDLLHGTGIRAGQAPLSPTTVRHAHVTLNKALKQAVKFGLIPRNVATLVDPPRPDYQEMQPLSREEARRLIETSADHRLGALILLAIATGMRQGELLGLRWSFVDLDRRDRGHDGGALFVNGNLQRSKRPNAVDGWLIEAPKTKRSRRQIALSREVVDTL